MSEDDVSTGDKEQKTTKREINISVSPAAIILFVLFLAVWLYRSLDTDSNREAPGQ